MPFRSSILTPDRAGREPIISILEAALAAVDPYWAVQRALRREDDILHVGAQRYDLNDYERILVLGAGKAAAPMTAAVENALGERVRGGLVVTKTDHGGPTERVELVEARHPVPDAAGADAGRRVLELAASATERDLVLVLLSGGGSALLVAPAEGITLDDIGGMTDALLASGATINEMNCLRKHCSAVKGGQLARAIAPAMGITLVLSDVVGNPLDVIASGPTVPDATSWQDAWTIVERYNLADKLPDAIAERLRAGLRGDLPDTPKPGDPAFARGQVAVVADNRIAAEAAAARAGEVGYNPLLLTTYLQGEAQEVAKVAVALGQEIRATGGPVPAPACVILGGETTVRLGASPGKGGRNQELALAAAAALEGSQGITVVSLATDGTDGPTDSAGGVGDGGTVARGRALGLDAEDALRRHDAYPFLDATNDLLVTGPTQTNVNDLVFVFVNA